MKKILIPTKLNKITKNILEEKGYNVILDFETKMEDLIKNNSDAEALIVRSEKVTSAIIDLLPNLKTIVRAGAGFDNIDVKYARVKNIDVMNTPGANANGVAEEAIAMMLAVSRFFIPADKSTRDGLWEKNNFTGAELSGKTVGVVGLGAIGQLVVKRLLGFECTFLGYDPFISADRARDLRIKLVSLDEIFEKSDYITLHAPETNETKGIINYSLLSKMKNDAVLVNCARSGLINEDDLRKVKSEKKIKFANDVYEKDAPGEKSVKDIADLMLPHLGASTKESNFNAAKRAAEELIDLWEKGITRFIVNARIPEGLDENYQDLAFHMTRLARAWLGGKPVRQVEASYYGKLKDYSKWMLSPIVSALDPTFNILNNYEEAIDSLKEKGVDYIIREVDNAKRYGESITLDLFCGDKELERISIRATIAEGKLMISRIADFHNLYFEPTGHCLFFTYEDRPAVLGKITSILGKNNINIHDIRAPHNESKLQSIAIIKTDKIVEESVVKQISKEIESKIGFYVNL